MIARLLALLFFSTFLLHTAAASAGEPASADKNRTWIDPGWRRTVARYYVKFDENGFSTTTYEFEYQPLTDKGVAEVAQRTFDYNSYFSDLTVSDLVTVKADGRTIPVDERAIRDQPASTDTSSPYFDEARVRTIAFSDVSPGDRVRGRLVYTDKRPRFPGEFQDYWMESTSEPPETVALTLDGPASKPLQIAVRGVDHTEERIGDRILHHVAFRQEAPKPRSAAFDGFDEARRFEVSTFKDYAAFAATLRARNAPMAEPDEAIKKFSVEIVGDAVTPRAKAERIHNWVAQHIRYVGIGFEDGGLTSQSASATLATRYGDCKAHAVLLKALLAAQGIEVDLVVVNATPHFTLTELATQNFNHAIVYAPAFDLYLDPTSPLVAFGALPNALYGKPVLNVDRGVIATIPALKPEQFTLEANTDYKMHPDGTRQVKASLSGTGYGASVVRSIAEYITKVDQGEFAKKRLSAWRMQGSGAYEFANPRGLGDAFKIDASFEIANAVALNRPTSVRMLPLAPPFASPSELIFDGASAEDFLCRSVNYEEIASLALPEGVHINQKPGDLSFVRSFSGRSAYGPVNGRVEIEAAVSLRGQTAHSENRISFTFSAPVCPANFSTEIANALSKFDEFRYGAIKLTPHPVVEVVEGGSDYALGAEAYWAKNYTFALMKFLSAAKENPRAYNYIGDMYQNGQGVAQDYHQAFTWYVKAAELGDALGQSHLGHFYLMGLGTTRDFAEAFAWYSKAANQGDAYSEASLAGLYAKGIGVTRDYELARQWYLKAAEQNDSRSQALLAHFYQDSESPLRDDQQAAYWYRRAADGGYQPAEVELGLLYANGRGVPLDREGAVEWFRKAAAQDNAWAQYHLGDAYEKGLGVAQDVQQAIAWYSKAANRGYAEARSRLDALCATHGPCL